MITAEEKFKEAQREVAMRKRVYPGLVERGKLRPDKADRMIAVMVEIMTDYAKLVEKERLI